MGEIIVSWSGYGSAWVTDTQPEPNQPVTLYAIPDQGATLDDIIATDSQGYSIALDVRQEQTFRYNSAWGTMFIGVQFSGGGPIPPTPTIDPNILILLKQKDKHFVPNLKGG